jgi:hypothetical protein
MISLQENISRPCRRTARLSQPRVSRSLIDNLGGYEIGRVAAQIKCRTTESFKGKLMNNQTDGERLWLGAKTLDELGELTARWIEGTLPYYPFYSGTIDPETEALQGKLADFNRHGLVTTFSQPAEPLDEDGFAQRACVEGYAREELAKRLAALGLYTDLLVLIYPADVTWGYQIPITLSEFQPFTWCGSNGGQEELDRIKDYLSEDAITSLASAWKVVVIDLQWGREDYLWDHVYDALTKLPDKPFSVAPYDEGLGTDFVF